MDRPGSLSDLVPHFIVNVPKDPFAQCAEPGYIAGVSAAILYSVGPNGRQDTKSALDGAKPEPGDDIAFRLLLPPRH